jgi:hypothetical protein
VRLTCFFERFPSRETTCIAPFLYALPLHVCDLGENGDNEFTDTLPYGAETGDLQNDTLIDQVTNCRLHVERIAAQSIKGINADDIAFPDVGQQLRKARP